MRASLQQQLILRGFFLPPALGGTSHLRPGSKSGSRTGAVTRAQPFLPWRRPLTTARLKPGRAAGDVAITSSPVEPRLQREATHPAIVILLMTALFLMVRILKISPAVDTWDECPSVLSEDGSKHLERTHRCSSLPELMGLVTHC